MTDELNMGDAIADALDIESNVVQYENLDQVVNVVMPENTPLNDRDTARTTIYKMLAVGEVTLTSALNMMNEVPTARGVETITGLLKAMSDMSKDLVDLHPEKKTVELLTDGDDGTVFIGTVQSLLANEKDDDDIQI